MQHNRTVTFLTASLTVLLLSLFIEPALASGGGGLPWEGPLQQIQQSITGPVAGIIALAAMAVAGGMLIFGGELNDFVRRLFYVVLVAGLLLGGASLVGLFGASGASIGTSELATASRAGEGCNG
ncbi:TrbC/VirB2 family protein [Aquamicrobium defluvii]|uniref:Type IV secretion system protein VirB2 n=1 Tax=Aquamicrobium defluvii TaxID=69279 RepID=A0A4V3DJH7_9HYPH|nr:TrbC/VirB2 family protein [Aquamicrobium defluvii]TDR28971.1 type IV secretion system protein VirB2 [Aquamicrobium defluvii]